MSRRERLERRMEQRTEWAAKATARSNAAQQKVRAVADLIPFGQPILVGHHSERGARRDAERIHNGMGRVVEEAKKADRHAEKAANIASRLAKTIFTDDTDAVQALKKRIAEREAEAEHMKAVNVAFRRAAGDNSAAKLTEMAAAGTITAQECLRLARFFAIAPHESRPYPSYALTNLRGSIRRDEERLAEVEAQQARVAAAQAAGGVLMERRGEYATLTFAEKPSSETLDALRAAGFRWCAGSWVGEHDALPAGIVKESTP